MEDQDKEMCIIVSICLTPQVASRNLCASEPQFTPTANGHHSASILAMSGSSPVWRLL